MRLTVRDVAQLLNVSEKSIYRWINKGEIPVYRVKEQYRFSKSEILAWATSRRISLPEELLVEPEEGSAPLPNLSEALEAGGIFYRIGGRDKTSVLKSVVGLLRIPDDLDRDFLHKILMAREELGSTGVGDGIAFPHVRNPIVLNVEKPSITLCFLEHKVDFDAVDGKPVGTLFTIISPTVRAHLHMLSRLAFALKDPKFKAAIAGEASSEEIIKTAKKSEAGPARHASVATRAGGRA